jgi:hypothetical protein
MIQPTGLDALFGFQDFLVEMSTLCLIINCTNLTQSLMLKGVVIFTIVPLLIVYIAYVFDLLFERHFMSEYAYK